MEQQTSYQDPENRPADPGISSRRRTTLIIAALLFVAGLGAVAALWQPWQSDVHVHAEGETVYTCPMHPQVVQNEPGICPICHMDLVPKTSAKSADTGASIDHSAMVHLNGQGRIVAAVRTVKAEYRSLRGGVQVPANVDFNEASQKVVSARYGGRIERLFVRETGQYVRAGAPLMEIYSPELLAAQREYLIARDAEQEEALPVGTSGVEELARRRAERADRLTRAARRRLELFGLTAAQIETLERRGEIAESVTVFAPVSGVVIRKGAVEGAYVTEGTMLLELIDLATVWVKASVLEADLPAIRPGMTMSITGPALGAETLNGRVDFIYPTVDAQSRTIQVRGLFSNAGGRLKPGMYVTASILTESGKALTVPVGAVVRTGKRDLVYIEVGKNMFEAREVRVGRRDGDYYEIDGGGLKDGDAVVAEGGYLLDSEATLSSGAADPHAGHDMSGK